MKIEAKSAKIYDVIAKQAKQKIDKQFKKSERVKINTYIVQ